MSTTSLVHTWPYASSNPHCVQEKRLAWLFKFTYASSGPITSPEWQIFFSVNICHSHLVMHDYVCQPGSRIIQFQNNFWLHPHVYPNFDTSLEHCLSIIPGHVSFCHFFHTVISTSLNVTMSIYLNPSIFQDPGHPSPALWSLPCVTQWSVTLACLSDGRPDISIAQCLFAFDLCYLHKYAIFPFISLSSRLHLQGSHFVLVTRDHLRDNMQLCPKEEYVKIPDAKIS